MDSSADYGRQELDPPVRQLLDSTLPLPSPELCQLAPAPHSIFEETRGQREEPTYQEHAMNEASPVRQR